MRLILITVFITAVSCGEQPFGKCPPIVNPSELDLAAFLVPRDFRRPGRPYLRSIPNGTSAHHVIPYTTLRQFYNATINDAIATNNADNLSIFAFYLERMINYIVTGVHSSTTSLTNFFEGQHADAIAFLRGLQYYRYTTWELPSRAMQRGFLYAFTYFAWLPGNIFIGPSPNRRNDDPTNSFETGVGPLVGQEQYNRLRTLNDMMERYVTRNNPPPFRQIVNMLQEVSNHTTFYDFDREGWETDERGRHGIITTTQNPNRHDEVRKRRIRRARENKITPATQILYSYDDKNEFKKRRKRSSVEVDLKMNKNGSCSGVFGSRPFHSSNKNACKFIQDTLIISADKLDLEIENSGRVKTFSFNNSHPSWFTNKDGVEERYKLSGKVTGILYYPIVSRCYIAIEDAESVCSNKYHYANNHEICSTAFYSFIGEEEVVANALRDPHPNFANSLLDLYVKNLKKNKSCKGVFESRSFRSSNTNACKLILDIIIMIPDKVKLEIESSGEVKTFSFKNSQAKWFTNKDGVEEKYQLSGKVSNILYYPIVNRCYIAIEDANSICSNKYHYANNYEICATAFYSFIAGNEVIANASRDPHPNYANSVLDLYVKNLNISESCTGVYKSRSYHSNDKNACTFIQDILLMIPGKVNMEIENSGEVKTFSFKNSQSNWFTNKNGIKEKYKLSGKVSNILYYPIVSRCYIAIEDADSICSNKYHYASNYEICSTALYSLIGGKEVVGNALKDSHPNYANSLIDLYVQNLCKSH